MLTMLQNPVFPGFSHLWTESGHMGTVQDAHQMAPKVSFNIDSILSKPEAERAAESRCPSKDSSDGPSWQPAAAPALPYGFLPYYPSLYLYKPLVHTGLAQQEQPARLPAGGGCPCSDPRCMQGLDLSRCRAAPRLSSIPWRSGHCKMKRVRTVFTPDQLERLEKEFLKQQYMVGTERVELAGTLHLTETQVKVWFQNRRIKWRKQSLDQKKAKLSKYGALQPDTLDHAEEKDSEDDNVEIEV